MYDARSLAQTKPGELPTWVTWTLVTASVLTVVLATMGMEQLSEYGDWKHEYSRPWSGDGFGFAVAAVLGACAAPPWRLSRSLRFAVLLPLVQVATMLAGIAIWQSAMARLPTTHEVTPYLRMLSPALVVAVALGATFAFGALIAIGRRGQWLQATATLALVQLLLFGLWLPIAVCAFSGDAWDGYTMENAMRHLTASPRFAAIVIVPPLVASIVFTAIAIRRYALVHAWRVGLLSAAITILLVAACPRMHVSYFNSIIYANFLHVLLALALVAAAALSVLAVSLWLRAARGHRMLARDTLTGTIVDDQGGAVARLHIVGWLRGPQVDARPFEVQTDAGLIAVPGGVEVVCAPPASSTRLASGEALVMLRPGDRVALTGFVKASEDAPYRGSAGMIPSSSGAWVAPAGVAQPGFAGVALAMWRPCVAYLLVAAAVMLPAIAGALST